MSEMEETPKEVYFDVWCPKCKHKDLGEEQDPCHYCLHFGMRENSHKPECWIAQDTETSQK